MTAGLKSEEEANKLHGTRNFLKVSVLQLFIKFLAYTDFIYRVDKTAHLDSILNPGHLVSIKYPFSIYLSIILLIQA